MSNPERLTELIPSELEDAESSLHSYEILTYPADYTLEVLVSQWNKKTITVPAEQRNFVWTQGQASKLIESFLMGLPVPPVYFYQRANDKKLYVVDGLQRLLSIVYFFSGYFGDQKQGKKQVFSLVGLHEKSPYKDMTFGKLREQDEFVYERLIGCVLRSFVMRQLQPQDDTSIFQVFERLNSGGMVLRGQEIRNCIYAGPFNALLKKINLSAGWRDILGIKTPDKRMRDIELILRAFALLYDLKSYNKPMKAFLNKFMYSHRDLPEDKRKRFEDIFERTSKAVVECLGNRPFHIHRGLNTAVYDSVFTAFAKRIERNGTPFSGPIREDQKRELRKRYESLLKNEDFLKATIRATTDDDVVPKRIHTADKVLFG